MKKKIAHLTFDMRIGGAEQVIYNLIEHTDPLKYSVSILCINEPLGPFGLQLQKKGYAIKTFNRQPGFDISLIFDIRSYILSQKIDIVHCHQYTPYVYGVLAAAFSKCKVIFTEHGRFFPDKKKIKRCLVNPVLNLFTDHVTAISSATCNALVEFENFPRSSVKKIYNGIDGSRFHISPDPLLKSKLGITENTFVLATVARLDPIKNQEMMIKALAIVRKSIPDVCLVIVGDGPERQKLENFVKKMRLTDKVIFTGFREDTHFYYKIMDIFLLTSFSEGTAMTLLEAMASSVPCIATGVGGNPEIVEHNKTGFIVPNDDEEALAEKILCLYQDKELLKRFSTAGKMRFDSFFHVREMVKVYEALYEN